MNHIVKPSNDMSFLAAAYGDGAVPKFWTPSQVMVRLVEMFDVIRRTPVRLGPSAFGSNWPMMVRDYYDMLDVKKYAEAILSGSVETVRRMEEDAKAEHQRILEEDAVEDAARKVNHPLPDETSRADEAMGWCLTYLQNKQQLADAIQVWAYCTAEKIDIPQFIRARADLADAMVRRRRKEILREIARDTADEANERMERAPRLAPAIRAAAHAGFRAAAATVFVRRRDVWPDRVFSRTRIDTCRREAADVISVRLGRDGVGVR